MLTRAKNPSRNNIESQDNSKDNSLETGIEHSPDYVQLIGKSLDKNEGSHRKQADLFLVSAADSLQVINRLTADCLQNICRMSAECLQALSACLKS